MKLTDEKVVTHLRLGGWITRDEDAFFWMDEDGQIMMSIPRIRHTGLADFSIADLDSEWKVLGNERTLPRR